jgi:hypothetical protein
MKKTLLFLWLIAGFAACGKTIYVPVESTRTEYRDNYLRDSIYLRDSVTVKINGDTVFIERDRYLYRDKLLRDSVYLNDTIHVPYPVEVPVKVNYVSGFQNFQIQLARILTAIVIGYLIFRYLKRKFIV